MRELLAAITYEALFTMVRRRPSKAARRIFVALINPETYELEAHSAAPSVGLPAAEGKVQVRGRTEDLALQDQCARAYVDGAPDGVRPHRQAVSEANSQGHE